MATTDERSQTTDKPTPPRKKLSLVNVLLILIALVCMVYLFVAGPLKCPSSGTKSPTITSRTRQGWLCDYDSRSEVTLWSKPARPFQDGNKTVYPVAVSKDGCTPATSTKETTVDGILYYYVTADDQHRGWVDVDYFYLQRSDFNP